MIEIKCSFPGSGRVGANTWAPLEADMRKVEEIVGAGAADWGIALMCVALPDRGNLETVPVETTHDGRCVAMRALSNAPLPDFAFSRS